MNSLLVSAISRTVGQHLPLLAALRETLQSPPECWLAEANDAAGAAQLAQAVADAGLLVILTRVCRSSPGFLLRQFLNDLPSDGLRHKQVQLVLLADGPSHLPGVAEGLQAALSALGAAIVHPAIVFYGDTPVSQLQVKLTEIPPLFSRSHTGLPLVSPFSFLSSRLAIAAC